MNKSERLEILRARLIEYEQARRAILQGQSYKMGDVELTRPNLAAVESTIIKLENEILKAQNPPRSRIRVVIPVDDVAGAHSVKVRRAR